MGLENEHDRRGVEQEALRWLSRLTSGAATEEDRAAFIRWRARPENEKAFQDSLRVWREVGLTAQANTALSSGPARHLARRQLLKAGAVAAGVGVVAMGGAKLGFWPGLTAMMADYATTAGEQKRVALGDHIDVELNTRSALSVDKASAAQGVTLSDGEAIFTVRPGIETLTVSAGGGVVALERGAVAIRRDGDQVRITCLEGGAEIVQPGHARLRPSEQVMCSGQNLGAVKIVDAEAVTGWRRGELTFRDEPLENVVSELNRYRKGMMVIASRAAAERRVTGLFYLDRLDEALDHIQETLHIPLRRLSPYFVVFG